MSGTTLVTVGSLPQSTGGGPGSLLFINTDPAYESGTNEIDKITVANMLQLGIPTGDLVSNAGGTMAALGVSENFTIASGGSLAIANFANDMILGNVSGTSEEPGPIAPTALFDSCFGSVEGMILVRGPTDWFALEPGTAGDVLTSGGVGEPLVWDPAGGSGPTVPGGRAATWVRFCRASSGHHGWWRLGA